MDALILVSELFKYDEDLGGRPYIDHLKRVASRFQPDSVEHTVALLHDVLEDITPRNPEYGYAFINQNFGLEIATAVDLLTKEDGETYDMYIKRLSDSGNVTAIRVKLSDLLDNMDVSGYNNLVSLVVKRTKRYLKAYETLTERLFELTKRKNV